MRFQMGNGKTIMVFYEAVINQKRKLYRYYYPVDPNLIYNSSTLCPSKILKRYRKPKTSVVID